jgi:hypothetical protein
MSPSRLNPATHLIGESAGSAAAGRQLAEGDAAMLNAVVPSEE